MRKAIQAVIGISILVGLVLVYNVQLYVFTGMPTIPVLENTWWAGYYDSHTFGKQWCIAAFNRDADGKIKMALLSRFGQPDVFQVSRGPSDVSFVSRQTDGQAPVRRVQLRG